MPDGGSPIPVDRLKSPPVILDLARALARQLAREHDATEKCQLIFEDRVGAADE